MVVPGTSTESLVAAHSGAGGVLVQRHMPVLGGREVLGNCHLSFLILRVGEGGLRERGPGSKNWRVSV